MIQTIKRCHVSIALIFSLALSACSTLAPDYKRPALPIPASFSAVSNSVGSQSVAADIPWREFFIDQKLSDTISLALEKSRDLKIAALTIEKIRAKYQIQRSELFPKIDASASANFQRVPAGLSGANEAKIVHQYNIGLGVASYELDLFGRVKNLKDSALQQYLATEHGRKALQISIVSEVATSYLTLSADIEHLKIAKNTLSNRQETYKLVKNRFDGGLANSLALSQAQTTVDTARLDIARYKTIVEQDKNRLNLLVGEIVPERLLPGVLSEYLSPLKEISHGINSDILLKRPDILQAESQLKSFNANIGAARGGYFPRITLVSSVGLGSDELSGLFSGDAFAWSFAPRISLPIFNAGSIEAGVKVAEVERDIAVAEYEKTIQNAFKEVNDALSVRATIDEQLSAQQSLENATKDSLKISKNRFDNGVDNFLAVLDSERSLYVAEQDSISVRLAKLANMITLYKVLGGGGV